MQFTLTTAGHCINNGTPKQRAACAALLEARDDKVSLKREITWPLGNITGNRAELMALHLGLAAVLPEWRHSPVVVQVRNNYVLDLLKRDGSGAWLSTPKKNEELVVQLRQLVGSFKSLQVAKGDQESLKRVSELVLHAAEHQHPTDSGTSAAQLGPV